MSHLVQRIVGTAIGVGVLGAVIVWGGSSLTASIAPLDEWPCAHAHA